MLLAGSSSGSGVEAPAENFFRRERPMGTLGGRVAVAVCGRQFLDKVYGGFWKNLLVFHVMLHAFLAHEICDAHGGQPSECGRIAHTLRGVSLART